MLLPRVPMVARLVVAEQSKSGSAQTFLRSFCPGFIYSAGCTWKTDGEELRGAYSHAAAGSGQAKLG